MNANENRHQPPVIQQIPIVVEDVPEPITMAGVQAMIRAMLAEQREEMRRMLNRDEPTVHVEPTEPVPEQSEEGNYSRQVSQLGTQDGPKRRNYKDGRMYKNFLGAKPPSLSGSPKPVEIMDWISEMEMVLELRLQREAEDCLRCETIENWSLELVEAISRYNAARRSSENVTG